MTDPTQPPDWPTPSPSRPTAPAPGPPEQPDAHPALPPWAGPPLSYPAYSQPAAATAPRKNSGLAVAALVLGLVGLVLSWFTFGIPSLLALIFGVVALRQTGRGPGKLDGRGMALTGAILGGVMTALGTLVSFLFVYAIGAGVNAAVDAAASASAAAPTFSPPPAEVTSDPPVDEPTSTAAAPKTFPMGYKATIVDGNDTDILHITLSSPRTIAGDEFNKAENGRFLAVTVAYEALQPDQDVNPYDLVAVTASGERLDPTFGPDAGHELNAATLNAGEKVRGVVVFDVPRTGVVGIAYQSGGQILGTWKL